MRSRLPPPVGLAAWHPPGPQLPLLTLRDGRRCRVGWDLAQTLILSGRATAAPGILVRVLENRAL